MPREIRFCVATLKFVLFAAWHARRSRVVVYHDGLSLLAEPAIRRFSCSVSIADVTEDLDLAERTSDDYRLLSRRLVAVLHRRMSAALNRASAVTTAGTAFVRQLREQVTAAVHHVTNYTPTLPQPIHQGDSNILRIAFPSVFSSSTGALFAVTALEAAPEHWHLHVIGAERQANLPPDLLLRMEALGPRISFAPPMSRAAYLEQIQSCDVGWVLLADNRRNLRLGLPNRFQDMVGVGLPVISTRIPSVLPFLEVLPVGASVPFGDIEALHAATEFWARRWYTPPARYDFDAAVDATTFEAVLPAAASHGGESGGQRPEAAIVAMRGLAHRWRVVLMCEALVAKGWAVRVICRHTPPPLPVADWTCHVSLCVFKPRPEAGAC